MFMKETFSIKSKKAVGEFSSQVTLDLPFYNVFNPAELLGKEIV